MTLCVGLTGGIGSGKSTVAQLFAQLGVGIVDADVIAHQLTHADGLAIQPIVAQFGSCYLNADGSLNRSQMRTLIFADPAAKQTLENILHPLIFNAACQQLQVASVRPYQLLVAPLLFEQPLFQQLTQRILVVDCPENLQILRTMQRSQLSAAEVQNIIAQQTPRTEKIRYADDIIDNSKALNHLENQVEYQHQIYLTLAKTNKH